MNANTFNRLYDTLTPHERLPLIVAAVDRGDDAEANRLAHSAPKNSFRLPDYYGLAEGWQLLALFQMIQLLELAAQYWHTSGALAAYMTRAMGEEAKAREVRMVNSVRFLAYLIVANVDGWNQLTAKLKIDSETLLRDLPAYATMKQAEQSARWLAFTADEAATYLGKAKGVSVVLETAESIARELRSFLDNRMEWWR